MLPQKGLRVLVVDSDLDGCELLKIFFALYGLNVITATCAREAIEKIQQFRPDLLISEICLPDGDGYSLMQQVRASDSADMAQIPSIALTVCAFEHERTQALAAGFCRHLTKPVNLDELMATVADLTCNRSNLS